MWFFPRQDLNAETNRLYEALREERVIYDDERPRAYEDLRRDVERIARGMDSPDQSPPMYWSGIPEPTGTRALPITSSWCLTLSVGGTNTHFLLVRRRNGEVVGLAPDGREVAGLELREARGAARLPTPTHDDVADGDAMVDRIVAGVATYLRAHREALESCDDILLSWGFAHGVRRTSSSVLGGISAVTTLMTKHQANFTRDLAGRDIGELFARKLDESIGWTRPVTVANDGVMALHFFLTPEYRSAYRRIGLFINGTGTNFSMAEPYIVRAEGVVSGAGESYQPDLLVPGREAAPGETVERFLINYETGSIELGASQTRFDRPDIDYPIEKNTLSGGYGLGRQFREFSAFALGSDRADQIIEADGPGGPEISQLADGGPDDVVSVLPSLASQPTDVQQRVWLVARAVVARSALHVALILAAVTHRTGFGRGESESGRPDLLAMEGSVWKGRHYRDLVEHYWRRLAEGELNVEFGAEPSFSASARGPLYASLLHRG